MHLLILYEILVRLVLLVHVLIRVDGMTIVSVDKQLGMAL